jgi:DNA-binding MarR family transcriptional regulator
VVDENSGRLQAAIAILEQAHARFILLAEPDSPEAGQTLRAVAERLYAERRRREEYFPPALFGEPAWDLLLALFIAREDGRNVSLSEAYDAAKVEPGQGPTLIEKLIAAGLVTRSHNRRNAVLLTDRGMDRLSDYLADLV